MDPVCFSDFDLLDSIPKPKCCSSLMTKEDAELLMKQRAYYMEEMERYSQELMKVIEDMWSRVLVIYFKYISPKVKLNK